MLFCRNCLECVIVTKHLQSRHMPYPTFGCVSSTSLQVLPWARGRVRTCTTHFIGIWRQEMCSISLDTKNVTIVNGGVSENCANTFLGFAPLGKKAGSHKCVWRVDKHLTPAPSNHRFLDTLNGSKLNFHMEGLPWKYVIWIEGLAIFKRAGHAGADMKIPIHTYFYLFLWILHRSWDRHGGSCLRLLASCHKENMMRRAIAMVNILQPYSWSTADLSAPLHHWRQQHWSHLQKWWVTWFVEILARKIKMDE